MLQVNDGTDKRIKGHQRVPSDSREFREKTKRDAQILLQHDLDKLLATAPAAKKDALKKEFDGFANLFTRFLQEEGPSVAWDKIERLPDDAVRDYTTLETPSTDLIHHMLQRLVVIKLNGGLGTSMGCHGPKSVISVRNDLTFLDLTVQQIEEEGPSVAWDKIERLPDDAVRDYTTLETPSTDLIHHMLQRLVVIKLNGGLGTSMGCHGPKSVISVRNDLTFLDLTVQQIEHLNKTYKTNVPLVLMNSFNTDEDTQKIVRKYKGLQVEIHTFNQSCFPRINRDSLLPIAKDSNVDKDIEAWVVHKEVREHLNKTYKTNVPLVLMNSFNTDEDTQKIVRKYKGLQVEIHTFNQSCFPRINRDSLLPIAKDSNVDKDIEAWYPPGHGDFYWSFQASGLLKKFIDQGRQYCFISNIDNLGATVDLKILDLLLNSKNDQEHEFVMEVTDKTRADVKGGTLIHYENKLRLLEIAQVPKEHIDDFKSVKTFKFFNTNNLWAKLDAIERVLNEEKLSLEIIINNKTLGNGLNVIQLETAVGAAMKTFENGIGINVPRSRFLPVKKTSDLLLVMSNLYSLKNGTLVMSPARMFPTTPLVKLGDNHFSKVKEFLARFANIPDLIELDHLTVSGDVTFGRGVALKGTVIIIANHGDRIDIPSGAVLENKIVSGNLRILDH